MNATRAHATAQHLRRLRALAFVCLLAPACAPLLAAQAPPPAPAPATPPQTSAPGANGELLDRIVAVVNDDLILESDVQEEMRFSVFQPVADLSRNYSRDRIIERLINRTLIVQQAKVQAQQPIPEKDVDAELAQLRKDIPACKRYHCDTDAGWQKFVSDQGFTIPELRDRWRQRMEVLRFIEQRFRAGARILPAQIKDYYDKTLLPEYAKENTPAPKLETVSDRIQEVLLQQQVSNLLQDWLKSLRAQGTVRVMRSEGAADHG